MPLLDTSKNSLRETYLKFFEGKGHKRLPSSSLLPENDPTVLFTTAGMQQFKRFYLFPEEAPATRITTCQKCVRTGDIDEVGDETHLTFFEMLGNFTFGYPEKNESYFKKESIEWAWEFLTEELEIEKSRIYATYFKGENGVPADSESLEILKTIDGLEDIREQGFEDNFWSLGTEGSPGGPTVEFYVDGVEVWNLVFNEFVMKNGVYEPSDLKGVDTGMGLERLAVMMQGKQDVYQTDDFIPVVESLKQLKEKEDESGERVILDHVRSAVFIINDGAEPLNKGQGYILRRLIRRAVVKARNLNIDQGFMAGLAEKIFESYPTYDFSREKIISELEKEEKKFRLTLENGLKELSVLSQTNGLKELSILSKMKTKHNDEEWKPAVLDADMLFKLFQSYGIPLEISLEEADRLNIPVAEHAEKTFNVMLKNHQELSRSASAGMFKGGLADNKIETTRLHTAAHLLLAALRHELGEEVEQKGSNITEERLRFDFNYPEKLTEEQIKKIEDLVNMKIKEGLPVTMQEMNLEEAKSSGATGSFHDRYGDKVKIFTVGPMEEPFSREICGGPHVSDTSELGEFKITKEESSSAGIRRIKAIIK